MGGILDNKTLELFNELLIDLIEEQEYEQLMTSVFKGLHDNYGDHYITNFVLYILYTADKISMHHINHGFADEKEEQYFNKLLAVEQNLESCFYDAGESDFYKEIIEVYSKNVNHA